MARHDDPPRDEDPADMTDFEKNATLGELESIDDTQAPERRREERGNLGPDEMPGYGQGA